MSLSERLARYARLAVGPRGLMVVAVGVLFVLMGWSFLAVSWNVPATQCGGGLCEIPTTNPSDPNNSLTGALFGPYAVLVLVIALVLASCMIGGVYLAKTEGGPGP